jgi:hypothetical protein
VAIFPRLAPGVIQIKPLCGTGKKKSSHFHGSEHEKPGFQVLKNSLNDNH